jgi:hypothetical protein
MFLIAIPVIVVAVAFTAASPFVGVAFGILALGALAAVGSALSGVFNAALYRFATTGEASGGFAVEDLSGTFRPRRGGLASRN